MIKLIGILFLLCSFGSFSYGQKKDIDYIKSTEYSPSEWKNKNSPLFKSSVTFSKEFINGNFYKKVRYNADSTIYDYTLEYANDGPNFEEYENVSIYYSFNDEGDPNYQIFHMALDTSRSTVNRISIEKKAENEACNSSMEIEYFSSDLTETYEVPDSITINYIQWVINDFNELDSWNIPPWLGSINWNLKKSRQSYSDLRKLGQDHSTTFYYVDKYFTDSDVIIDTLFIKETHSNLVTEKSKTWSLNEVRTDSTLHHEEYFYFSDKDSTYQIMYDLLNKDTLLRVFLSTVLIDDTLYSYYRIIGNSQNEIEGNKRKILGKVLERDLSIKRDLQGYIIEGTAKGIVVDDLQGNQQVECKIVLIDEDKLTGQKKLVQSQNAGNSPFPGKVYVEAKNGTYLVEYDLISTYPNIDLKPLSNIKLLWADGIFAHPYEVSPKINNRKPKKSRNVKPEYKRDSKRVQTNRKMKYEKWEKINSFNELTIYEVYFN